MNRLFVPFCVKTMVMEILIGAMMLFLLTRIASNSLIFNNKKNPSYNELQVYFDPRSDFFINCFLWTSFMTMVYFYFMCNLITVGMKNVQLRYEIILIGMCISVINVILCIHIIHEYYDSSSNKILFDGYSRIVPYNLMFSALTFLTGIYALVKGGDDIYVIENGNYYNLCFDITMIHLGFIGMVYFLYQYFMKSKVLKRIVAKKTWIKWIQYISYILPFMWLVAGEIYVFNRKPFSLVYKIVSFSVFLVTLIYILLLIKLITEMCMNMIEYTKYKFLSFLGFVICIIVQLFLSVLLLIIPLHITLS